MKIILQNDELILAGLFRSRRLMLGDVVRVQLMADEGPRLQRDPFTLWNKPFLRFVMLGTADSSLTLDHCDKGFDRAVQALEQHGWRIAEAKLRCYEHPLVREEVERSCASGTFRISA